VARISRKQLKHDRFVEEVGQSVVYVSSHRKQLLAGGGVALALIIAIVSYAGHRRTRAAEAKMEFQKAVEMYHGKVDTEEQSGGVTFPTTIARVRDTTEQLEKITSEYAGREEAVAADYYLALLEIEREKMDEAKTRLEGLVGGNGEYAALGRLALADMHARREEDEPARRHYQHLIDNPTRIVPKTRAQLALARYLSATDKEDEAKTILEEMMKQPGEAGISAGTTLTELDGS
jgi:predicted negative regulator of RcsB-dependent stress response